MAKRHYQIAEKLYAEILQQEACHAQAIAGLILSILAQDGLKKRMSLKASAE